MALIDAIDLLTPEGAPCAPGKQGRGKAEWDWYFELGTSDRAKVRRHMRAGGLAPDQCARAAGFDYVDEWAEKFVAAITARKEAWQHVSEYPDTMPLAPDALVGPVEVAEMCAVKIDTVYQWVTRGRLPEPWATVSGTRLWPRHVIEQWALESGRLVAPTSDPGF